MTANAIRCIRNGRVISPSGHETSDETRDLYIDDEGKITSTPPDESSLAADQIIDASGKWVIPGLVDLSARFREPGHEHKANIETESRAALANGITTVCIPPDTDPVIDTPAVVDLIRQRGEQHSTPRLEVLGAATVNLECTQLSEIAALKSAGCAGISNALKPITNHLMMRHIMDYSASHGMKVFLSPVDGFLSEGGCAHEGRVASRLGLQGIPSASEVITISRDLALVETTGVQAHFNRLSTADGVALIADAQARGLPVTADVSIHQLFLTEVDVTGFNNQLHVLPPLRTERDRDALILGIKEGVIGAICSDHQPHEADAKLSPFAETEPGISAIDTWLPLLLKLAETTDLSLQTVIAAATMNPAAILGKPSGQLQEGMNADICIIDPETDWIFDASKAFSKGKHSPFNGWSFNGKVSHTLINGQILHQAES